MGPRVSDPDPGRPLTDDETRSWVDLAYRGSPIYLGHLTGDQVDELLNGMVAQYPPDHHWAPKVADALWERWRVQRTAHLAALWERAKRDD